jgi:hypothetical protein
MQEMEIEKKESRPMESGLLVQNQVYAGLDCPPIYKGIWGSERKMQEAKARGEGVKLWRRNQSSRVCRVVSRREGCFVCRHNAMRCDAMRWRSGVSLDDGRRP